MLLKLEHSAKSFPPLYAAVREITACTSNINESAQLLEECKQQAEEVDVLKQLVRELQIDSGAAEDERDRILGHIEEAFGTDKRDFRGKTLQMFELKRRRRCTETQFRQLQVEAIKILRKDLRMQSQMSLLQRLSPVERARYNSSDLSVLEQLGLLEEGLTTLREELNDWAHDQGSSKIYWVTGVDKTKVVYDLCKRLDKSGKLGASFFCSANSPSCGDCRRIVPTIAYQLARNSSEFRSYICDLLQNDPDIGTLNVGQQLNALIPDWSHFGPTDETTVVVIDALDECKSRNEVDLIIKALLSRDKPLPFKVLVTSRHVPAQLDKVLEGGGLPPSLIRLNNCSSHYPTQSVQRRSTQTAGCARLTTPKTHVDALSQEHTHTEPPGMSGQTTLENILVKAERNRSQQEMDLTSVRSGIVAENFSSTRSFDRSVVGSMTKSSFFQQLGIIVSLNKHLHKTYRFLRTHDRKHPERPRLRTQVTLSGSPDRRLPFVSRKVREVVSKSENQNYCEHIERWREIMLSNLRAIPPRFPVAADQPRIVVNTKEVKVMIKSLIPTGNYTPGAQLPSPALSELNLCTSVPLPTQAARSQGREIGISHALSGFQPLEHWCYLAVGLICRLSADTWTRKISAAFTPALSQAKVLRFRSPPSNSYAPKNFPLVNYRIYMDTYIHISDEPTIRILSLDKVISDTHAHVADISSSNPTENHPSRSYYPSSAISFSCRVNDERGHSVMPLSIRQTVLLSVIYNSNMPIGELCRFISISYNWPKSTVTILGPFATRALLLELMRHGNKSQLAYLGARVDFDANILSRYFSEHFYALARATETFRISMGRDCHESSRVAITMDAGLLLSLEPGSTTSGYPGTVFPPSSGDPSGVPKFDNKEEDESVLRWIECKALLLTIWKDIPAVPCVASRRAWALAHGVDPARVHSWFKSKKAVRMRNGLKYHPDDNYSLQSEDVVAEDSSSIPPVPSLDQLSSPRYLPMSSPSPQTPMDMVDDCPATLPSIRTLEKAQIAYSKPLEAWDSTPHPPPLFHSTHFGGVKNQLTEEVKLTDRPAPSSQKKRKVVLRVVPETEDRSSRGPRQCAKNSNPTTRLAQPKKRGRRKKVPKVEITDTENEISAPHQPQPQLGMDQTCSVMILPPGLPAGFHNSPYIAYIHPSMAFGNGMTMAAAPHLSSQPFGNMMYNPFTGAPLFNNPLMHSPNLQIQPHQSMLFNGGSDPGFPGQMLPQVPVLPSLGSDLNAPGNAIVPSMDQASFFGNPQNYPSGMPIDAGAVSQTPLEPMVSILDFLNEPLSAGWTYPSLSA
ncbi:Gar1/Naf1 RNA-binding region protein [Rhizoctonia solani]|uniref:Gar1/Naf1 RNA-binding region protein n=1 Tax=Rhizoctonia solani TaxID=456999 RepID=A0A8H8P1W6_9AGAM|nr:Gar1/Naf1 RNA-binding region protein [Rhizoctonia solani]QRW22328.1 Gar1/Naf1 RNA-binding region protein [Rhizoctonia solani]